MVLVESQTVHRNRRVIIFGPIVRGIIKNDYLCTINSKRYGCSIHIG